MQAPHGRPHVLPKEAPRRAVTGELSGKSMPAGPFNRRRPRRIKSRESDHHGGLPGPLIIGQLDGAGLTKRMPMILVASGMCCRLQRSLSHQSLSESVASPNTVTALPAPLVFSIFRSTAEIRDRMRAAIMRRALVAHSS